MLSYIEETKLTRHVEELDFACGIHAISVFRCIAQSISDLALNVKTRILKGDDMICALVLLVESAPWLQRSDKGEYSRFEGGAWTRIKKDDLPIVSRVEGQVWLALFSLLMDAECRRMYEYATYNYNIVMRVRNATESCS